MSVAHHNIWDAAREVAQLWLHREQYIEEFAETAADGHPGLVQSADGVNWESLHGGCETCAEARTFVPILTAALRNL